MRHRVILLSALVLVFGFAPASVCRAERKPFLKAPVPQEKPSSKTLPEQESSASDQLAEVGIPPTVAGVSAYLAAQVPSDEAKREAEKWIADLRSGEFLTREKAERDLLTTGNPPVEALTAAAADLADPESALRAARILKEVSTRPRTTLHLVLRWSEAHPDPAFVPLVLTLSAHTKTSVERSLINRVLATASTEKEFPLIAKYAGDPLPAVRSAAVAALSHIPTEPAAEALATLAADPDETIRLAAVTALADRSDRRCLAPLGKLLLESEATATRMRAHHLLGAITGKKWDYSAYAPEEARTKSAHAILEWIAKEGATAELTAGDHASRQEIFVGRTVVGSYPNNFQHFDFDGKLLFTAGGFTYVWGCHGTADGQFAVVDARRKTARIYDALGEEVWSNEDLPGDPSDIQILPNGNRLITLSTPSRVIEYDPSNALVWEKEFPGKTRATTAQRLPNGNTLVNLQFGKKVVEINPSGEVVWELTGMENCLTAQPLPEGNVLVCDMNLAKAIEYNREGEIVWEKGGFNNACQAQRLPSGNTLISDAKGIHEIDPEGNEVSHLEVPRGRFWRY